MRRKSAKLSLGMRWAPPSAQRILVALEEKYRNDKGFVEALWNTFAAELPDRMEDVSFIMAVTVHPGRMVNSAAIARAPSGFWIFEPISGQFVDGCPWEALVRFDVALGAPFSTVGFAYYDGETPIDERLQQGGLLQSDELTGGHFYMGRAPDFLRDVLVAFQPEVGPIVSRRPIHPLDKQRSA